MLTGSRECGTDTRHTPESTEGHSKRPLLEEAKTAESPGATLARASLRPTTQAALTLQGWRPINAEQDINDLATELRTQVSAANGGDLGRMEAMLVTQAHALDAMFNDMARRARANMAEYPEAFERYLRLSLRALSQCRATIESLAEIKNPKSVAFVQQANIAGGHQQVNNGSARAGGSVTRNEVLEGDDGNRLEHGASGASGVGNPQVEAVGALYRAEVPAGEGESSPEQLQARSVQR